MSNQLIEKEIQINGEPVIYGSITIPARSSEGEKFPAVLLIAGSGPIDRNGNGPKGKYQFNLYKELAEFVTGLGFITFRFDKRGTGKSKEDLLSSGFWDYVNDAEQCYLFLKNHPNVDPNRIIVLGHSEGTIIGTALSERQPIGGLMLVAGGVANLEEFLAHQRKLAYKELRSTKGFKGVLMRKLINEEKEEQKIKKMMKKMFNSNKEVYKAYYLIKQPVKWFKEHFAYDTREALRKVTCPVFAIHGDKDPLVDNAVLEELSALVKGKAEFHIIKDMEHGLRLQQEERSISKHKKMLKHIASRPLNPEGLDAISKWLVSNYKESVPEDKIV